ncbi:MAG: hypothetical protein H6721_19875 [Sandaracinus sp.]|nr:hypothetical protein [Sandaracinus sp.]MCB9619674.1 hypothetical protein [Sandaracinus sp.]MCB9634389.1 hypothetical protein [Sandaracinus sp.]
MSSRSPLRINHAKLRDAHGLLSRQAVYFPCTAVCRTCGKGFELTPERQRYLLEVRRNPVKSLLNHVVCLRCLPALREKARLHALSVRAHQRLEACIAAEREAPDDPKAMLAVVEAHLALLELVPRETSFERLVARTRRAAKHDASRGEPPYWEGRVHQLAGHVGAAYAAFERALEPGRKMPSAWARDARRRLEALATPPESSTETRFDEGSEPDEPASSSREG